MEELCKSLPKIELHAHLNGSLSPTTLKELGCTNENVKEYQRLNNILQKTNRTLNECFQLFDVAYKATSNPSSVYKACESVIQDFADDNVIYLELRTTPRSGEQMSEEDYVETVIKAIKNNKTNMIVKLLLSINRSHDVITSNQCLELIINLFKKYSNIIVGIDLSGNPSNGFFDKDLFKRARDAGLMTSLHCAEIKNDKEVSDILKFQPDRIGHATCLHSSYGGDEELWKLYCSYKIPAEFCLTSNVVCGTSKSYKEHHIREWLNTNLPFCLSTDDKGVFATTLSHEYCLAGETFNLSIEDLWKITYDTIAFSFASYEEKKLLQEKLEAWKKCVLV